MDLAGVLGGQEAFAGFTSATGGAWSNHDLLYWRYTEAVPEPSSLALLLTAGAGVGLASLRRRRNEA